MPSSVRTLSGKNDSRGIIVILLRSFDSFNPHPARGPSATVEVAYHVRVDPVSILTRPAGRVLWAGARGFNPHLSDTPLPAPREWFSDTPP